jgi:hypothetical protein
MRRGAYRENDLRRLPEQVNRATSYILTAESLRRERGVQSMPRCEIESDLPRIAGLLRQLAPQT